MPLRRLTRLQYDNTVRDVLGVSGSYASSFPDDDRAGAFPANPRQSVSDAHVRRFMDAAEQIAGAAPLERALACDVATGTIACAEAFIRSLGARAFRRGISEQQVVDLLEVFRVGAQAGFKNGISLVVEAILESPSFLYHVENKTAPTEAAVTALAPRELAARLSYFLWQSLPDQPLLDATDGGALQSADQLRQQGQRMLEDPRALAMLDGFSGSWLGLSSIEQLVRDAALFPTFSDVTARAMKQETLAFVRHVFASPQPSLKTLLSATFSVVPDELLPIYGVTRPFGQAADAPLELDPAIRAGLLTHASVLATHSPSDHTSPVKRGVFVLNDVLCHEIALPVGIKVPELPPLNPQQSSRERFLQHEQPGCAGCHIPIDHLGFALERYDSVGAYRASQGGTAIDESGALTIGSSVDGDVTGAVELSKKLLEAPETRACFTRQWRRFALGRLETDADACPLHTLTADFEQSGLDFRKLMLDIIAQDAFRSRPAVPQ